ncbi:hypothetical protein [Cellulomonas sp. P24]|uniref:hypothetical protein n=1 Tax=Cellulomonas sp. P24 TaxID=2885206 RepID=UPI00216B4871|nr:hypothetical protein [Cellulomonas sp. P24]MCR6494513.1 hypothetical protein [Cellulomonas sp. P24]
MGETSAREARLRAKLQPAALRATLTFAGLFQLTHEMIKSMVLDDVKGFFGFVADGVWLPASGESEYRREVLELALGKPFEASLLWLQSMDAVTSEQAKRLDDIYAHRHRLTHELASYLADPDLDPDVDLFVDALKTLSDIARFWTRVEADLGSFDRFPEVDLDEVVNGRVALLGLCIQAYSGGLDG